MDNLFSPFTHLALQYTPPVLWNPDDVVVKVVDRMCPSLHPQGYLHIFVIHAQYKGLSGGIHRPGQAPGFSSPTPAK
jgi:hypothetical protein